MQSNWKSTLACILCLVSLSLALRVGAGRVGKPAVSCDLQYSFAVLSDIHIGDSDNALHLAQSAVSKINSIAAQNNIKWVFITGDLTNSAYIPQYQGVYNVLNALKVPWIPLIGNHDTWQYNSTWEEQAPTGDALFARTFIKQLQMANIPNFEYENTTCYNSDEKITSWFQNWKLEYCGLIFLSNDWNSRASAATSLGYKGAWPGAELHNYPGGTLQWLQQQLAKLQAIPNDDRQVVLMQHHPFRAPFGIPDFIYGFSGSEKDTVRALLSKYLPVQRYWGVIAGHWHRWFNGTAFDEWPSFRQWETEACKASSAFTLVKVSNGRIADLIQMYGQNPPGTR